MELSETQIPNMKGFHPKLNQFRQLTCLEYGLNDFIDVVKMNENRALNDN